jgi:hypothetical protein
MPERKDESGRVRSVSKMSKEDAERLRELLRRTGPADMSDPAARQRVGKIIAQGSTQAVQAVISLDGWIVEQKSHE